jgi:hypothetical protein
MKCSGKILKIILLVVIISSFFCQSVMAQTQPEPASGDTPRRYRSLLRNAT